MKQFLHIEDLIITRNLHKQIDQLTGKQNTMGIIEPIKQLTFEKGLEKGIEKGKMEVVTIFISTGNFSISQIANFANVPESFVRKIKKEQKK